MIICFVNVLILAACLLQGTVAQWPASRTPAGTVTNVTLNYVLCSVGLHKYTSQKTKEINSLWHAKPKFPFSSQRAEWSVTIISKLGRASGQPQGGQCIPATFAINIDSATRPLASPSEMGTIPKVPTTRSVYWHLATTQPRMLSEQEAKRKILHTSSHSLI